MKIVLILLLFIVMCNNLQAQIDDSDKLLLDKKLQNVLNSDQQIRKEAIAIFHSAVDIEKKIEFQHRLDSVDQANQQFVFAVLDSQGWPSGLSAVANQAIFLVIDHAKLEDQKKYLPLVKEQSSNGILDKSAYATLYDRVQMHSGKKQIYGTQTILQNRGQEGDVLLIWPIQDSEKIDSLRQSVNLPPLNDYVKVVSSMYGKKCYWDKSLEVKDIRFNGK
ncbi:DUF6624 domain-containing protein [Parabacteroides johnsonii]|uniref:DUF6624 domain-containing protein n=1 Tax=Parabacteroides johnsonii TaxID=387661 RepID=UPI003AB31783